MELWRDVMKMLLILVGVTMSAQNSHAQPSQAAQSSGLAISVRTLGAIEEYAVGDKIDLEITLYNSSLNPIGLYSKLGLGYQGGLIIHVLDGNGKEVMTPSLQHDFLDLKAIEDPKNYILLNSHHLLGVRHSFILSEFVAKPGYYKMIVEYHSPINPSTVVVENLWGSNRKSIISDSLNLKIK